MTGRSCLCLDLDGTLADSLGVMRAAYDSFLTVRGRTPTDAEFAALNGPPLPEVVRRLQQAHGIGGDADALTAAYFDAIAAAYRGLRPNPGAGALLEAAAALDVPVAVVTSSSEAIAADWLGAAGLAPLVGVVIGYQSCRLAKPHPDPYLVALTRLGGEAAASIAVEDSRQGAQAACAAGLRTFVLGAAPADAAAWPAVAGFVDRLDQLVGELRHAAPA